MQSTLIESHATACGKLFPKFVHQAEFLLNLICPENLTSNRTSCQPRLPNRPMRCWVVGVCLCLIVVTSGCQSFSQLLARRGGAADASRLMQGGTDALHDGRLGQAESLLSRAAQTRPRDPRIRENLAHALAGQGKLEQAIENMSRAVEKSHGDPLLNVQLGQLYLQAGRTVPASRQAAIALEQNRKLPEAWVLKAETELARNNLETACLLYTSPSPRDRTRSRMPSSA